MITINSLSKLSYGKVSDNFIFFNICRWRKVLKIHTIVIPKHIRRNFKSVIIENWIQNVKYKNIIIKNPNIKAKYLNIVLLKFQLSSAFFRKDNQDESKADATIHNITENIFVRLLF